MEIIAPGGSDIAPCPGIGFAGWPPSRPTDGRKLPRLMADRCRSLADQEPPL